MTKCLFDGCDRKPFGKKEFCKRHYEQKRNGNSLKPIRVQFHGLSEYERFLKWVDVREVNECWNWKSCVNDAGYGVFMTEKKKAQLAHRAAWRLMKGTIPGNVYVLHKCDNPKCVNPAHLFLGSQQDNMTDMWNKGRANPGWTGGEKNGRAKLTDADVQEIRASSERGIDLAERFNVSETTICKARKGRIWKHVT